MLVYMLLIGKGLRAVYASSYLPLPEKKVKDRLPN